MIEDGDGTGSSEDVDVAAIPASATTVEGSSSINHQYRKQCNHMYAKQGLMRRYEKGGRWYQAEVLRHRATDGRQIEGRFKRRTLAAPFDMPC